MKTKKVTKPFGLKALCREVESICERNYVYHHCGIRPNHLIVPLDPKSGRTTFLEYLTDMFKLFGVLSFCSGLDDFIEVFFDGSLSQLYRAFSEIDSAAIYENDYTGIVGMDISNLAAHLYETQLSEFMKRTKKICDHAFVVFFVHNSPSSTEERLIEKITGEINNVKRIEVEPYTNRDYVDIIVRELTNYGLNVKDPGLIKRHLLDHLEKESHFSVGDALSLSQSLLFYADYSTPIPTVDAKKVVDCIHKQRSEVITNEQK